MSLLNDTRLKEIAAGTGCATCKDGKHPAVSTGKTGQWVHLYEDGSFIGPCFDPLRAELLAAVRTARYEAALARDTAFWLDCRWDVRRSSRSEPERGANHCLLEGTHVCALCQLADATSRAERAEAEIKQLQANLTDIRYPTESRIKAWLAVREAAEVMDAAEEDDALGFRSARERLHQALDACKEHP